jgi:hypothetical protein
MRCSPWSGVAGLFAVTAFALIPLACAGGGVGDPCTPEEEYVAGFAGFNLAEVYIESRSFQCSTRVCLVNHFQGRVSCPLGQSAAGVRACSGPGDDASCGSSGTCTAAETFAEPCVPCDASGDPTCPASACPEGLTCDPAHGVCTCDSAKSPTLALDGVSYGCSYFDPACVPGGATPCAGLLQSYVCHVAGACQSADATPEENQGKACCLPGTDVPVSASVCGQCAPTGQRDAASAVYCSCRCGVADGDPPEPDFNFCACPSGFSCEELRPDLKLGDPELTGKYCVQQGSVWSGSAAACGASPGNHELPCAGLAVQ